MLHQGWSEGASPWGGGRDQTRPPETSYSWGRKEEELQLCCFQEQEWISTFSKRTSVRCAGYKRADWLCEAAGLCPPPGSCLQLASSSRWWTAAPRRPGGGLQPCTPAPWAHRTSGSVREDDTDLCLSWRKRPCQSALKIKGNIRITNF